MSSVNLTVKIDTTVLDQIVKEVQSAARTEYIVHDGVNYGVMIEFGTVKMSAKPALVPAWEKHTKRLPQILRQMIDKNGAKGFDIGMRLTAMNIVKDWQSNVPVKTGAYKNSITMSEERS